MEKKIYELAIKQLRELFPKWFERLLKRREQLGIKEKRPLRKYGFESVRNISLETELETDCNSFIYDYCFSNKERFRLFSKQFSSKETFAESIALQALNKIFYEANAYLNQFEITKNRAEREKNLLHQQIEKLESEPKTNNDEIEDLYASLPNAKQITKLYLYALYYKYQKDIDYVDALNEANGIICIDKDIIDLQNSFKTWRVSKKGKDLESKVIEIVINKK